jgi:chemotaxis protein methyltransferase CheR
MDGQEIVLQNKTTVMALTDNSARSIYNPRLTTSEFQQLSKLVYAECGIHLAESKKVMLESRLSKRLRSLNMSTFNEYIQFVTSQEGIDNELVHMIDAVTTNKTDFFREPHHFEFLKNTLLPDFNTEFQNSRPYRTWSAACSSGEEPYTLAMVMQDFAALHPRFSYSILASDISTQVLQKASLAIYNPAHIQALPMAIKQRYFLKSKDQIKPTVRVVASLREKVEFVRINLMNDVLDVSKDLDSIFCRNVLIYFDRNTQEEVVNKLAAKLRPGGCLFIGHSESLHQLKLPLKQIKPTVFVKI